MSTTASRVAVPWGGAISQSWTAVRPRLSKVKTAFRNTWLSPRYIGIAYIRQAIEQSATYAHGQLVDIGCGLRPYQQVFAGHVSSYIGMDWPAHPERSRPHLIGDALHMPFLDGSVDTVLATEIMEHVPDCDQFLKEVDRILRPSGSVILSVPLMEPLHEEPRDYYRFTPYGLRALFERHGFSIDRIWTRGGWWSVVLGSFVSKALYDFANPEEDSGVRRDRWWRILPVLPFCTAAQLIAYALDRLPTNPRYTLGYVVLANRRPASDAAAAASDSLRTPSKPDRGSGWLT